tara:strand:- start:482 stop:694 length:213 start_codon:yes stop_codon:yes gene_type:complete
MTEEERLSAIHAAADLIARLSTGGRMQPHGAILVACVQGIMTGLGLADLNHAESCVKAADRATGLDTFDK